MVSMDPREPDYVDGVEHVFWECPYCRGIGLISGVTCPTCNGHGEVPAEPNELCGHVDCRCDEGW